MENSVGSTSQKAFLSNVYNKQCLIDLLEVALESNGHSVVKCNNDADTAIVSTVLAYACQNKDVCLVAATRISSSCSCICGTIQWEELP